MAKAPELVEIRPQDYPAEAQELIEQLAGPLNTFMRQVVRLLGQRLTFSDNFDAELRELTITGGSSVSFRYEKSYTPKGLLLVSYTNTTDRSEVITSPVGVPQWTADGRGNITVEAIPNLTTGDIYDIIILVISE